MIWEAIRATLAEPELFPPIGIRAILNDGPTRADSYTDAIGTRSFFGARLGHSNPTKQALVEVTNILSYQESLVSCIISVGAGSGVPVEYKPNQLEETTTSHDERDPRDPDVDDPNDFAVQDLYERFTRDPERIHQEIDRMFTGRPFYYRLNHSQTSKNTLLQGNPAQT